MLFKHIKPYLFILAFIAIPLLFVPLIKLVKNHFNNNQHIQLNIKQHTKPNYALAIHGGAGNFTPDDLPDSLQTIYRKKLTEALNLGMDKLNNGDSAIQVVIAVIKILENSPLFNAGKGAVFTHEGKNELDASIMNGINKNAGAVAGVTTIKNPIEAAYKVMTNSEHVLLAGKGAEQFAAKQKLELVDPAYFYTKKRWLSLQKALHKEKMGTVGCVVLDAYGNLAAGTSTGGMTNKKYGRIGDSPIIGAGTYADNNYCAISATGHGEFFIRYTVAYDITARLKYLNQNIRQASNQVIQELKQAGGNGGVICIDKNGNINMPFNTTGMFRGYCTKNNKPHVFFFKN